jgi:hypothetical protein
MCNFCATASGFPLGFGCWKFDDRSTLKPIERAIDDVILGVGIAEYHCQAFVTGKFLNGFDVGT